MQPLNAEFDRATLVALAVIAVGWFGMATLVVHFGPWRQNIHFYDLVAVINDPARRLIGVDRPHPFLTCGFAIICCAALLAAAAAFITRQKTAWLGCLAPLILMLFTGAVLYSNTSAEYFHPDSNGVTALLAQIAQSAAADASRAFARNLSIGTGAYLAFLASSYLAFRGVNGFRAAGRIDASEASASADFGDVNSGTRQIEP